MKNRIIRQYKGFINTPSLWSNTSVFDIDQFEIDSNYYGILKPENFNEIRLGKRVEQFFGFQIEKSSEFELIASNIQVKNQKLTIGEIDALVSNIDQTFHIEIVYKFYLYDDTITTTNQLKKWIGPNRRDSLIYKLSKLKEKQLPLLYSDYSTPILEDLKIDATHIKQGLCYKAQLFLPFNSESITISPLNKEAICGFYISFSKLSQLNTFQFYIPKKMDWLINPNLDVKWSFFEEIKPKIETFINEKRSPMVWIKSTDDKLQKCFITFW